MLFDVSIESHAKSNNPNGLKWGGRLVVKHSTHLNIKSVTDKLSLLHNEMKYNYIKINNIP